MEEKPPELVAPDLLDSELTDEQIKELMRIAHDEDLSSDQINELINSTESFNARSSGGFSTFALPKNLQNEFNAIYKAGSNIVSQLNTLYNAMPTSNGDLREQIREVTKFVMTQDKWIELRIQALADVVSEYGIRITNVSSRAEWAHTRIDSTNSELYKHTGVNARNITNLSSTLADVDSWVNKRIDSTNSELYKITGNNSKTISEHFDYFQNRVNEVWTALGKTNSAVEFNKKTNSDHFDFFQKRINEVWDDNGSTKTQVNLNTAAVAANFLYHQNRVNEIWDKIPATVTAVDTRLTGINSTLTKKDTDNFAYFQNRVNEVWTPVSQNTAQIATLSSTINGLDFFGNLRAFVGVNDFTNNHGEADGAFTKLIKTQNKNLLSAIAALDTNVKNVKTEITNVGSKIKDYTTLLTTLNATNLLNTTAVNGFKDKVDESFKTLFVGVDGLKNAVNASKYDDSSLKKLYSDVFASYFGASTSHYESGIVPADQMFTRLVKGQFTRLMNDNFLNLNVFNKSLTDNLRAEFKLLNDWFALVVDWLDMLYEKPSAVFETALFDYERLQEMLDGISFGNVVNEAGTNLWDVLQELISALGGVLESIVSIVPDLIKELIALIIPENPNFFSEDVNSLIDSFDSKFEWAFSISDSFNSVFSQPKSIKALTIPIAGKQYKVVPDFVDLGLVKTILTGYFCFLTMLTTYRRIVGSGDLVQ